ncbi:MAG: helix-turn-helix domain-containing protein [Elusimicrobia bacterium]|nr:helix-turn-helix domain-containing protein [Elusimicrobiota bacterium]
MGVVYKLRQEVIDFIIDRKQKDPAISCRKMVGVVQERFQVEVSKSSVNAVMKQAALSNPVGRPSHAKPPKNFSIPREKKAVLMKNVEPFLSVPLPAPVPAQELPAPLPEPLPQVPERLKIAEGAEIVPEVAGNAFEPLERSEEEAPEPETVPEGREDLEGSAASEEFGNLSIEEPVVQTSLMPDICAVPVAVPDAEEVRLELVRASADGPEGTDRFWDDAVGIRYEQGGMLAVCALFWAATEGLRIREAAGISPSEKNAGAREYLWKAQLVRKLLVPPDDPAPDPDIFQILGAEVAAGPQEPRLELTPEQAIRVESLLGSASSAAHAVRLSDGKGNVLICDPLLSCVDGEAGDPPIPLFSSVRLCADLLVANTEPLVLHSLPEGVFKGDALLFFQLMGTQQGLSRVEVLGEGGKVLFETSDVPQMSRIFVARAALTDEEFARLDTDVIQNPQSFFDPFSDQQLTFSETQLSLADGDVLRVLVVEKEGRGEKMCLLTNAFGLSSRDILFCYGKRGFFSLHHNESKKYNKSTSFMGNTIKNEQEYSNNTPLSNNSALEVVKGVVSSLLNMFWGLSGAEWAKDIALLSGEVKRKKGFLLIRLELPAGLEPRDGLGDFLQRLNAMGIPDGQGHVLFFSSCSA